MATSSGTWRRNNLGFKSRFKENVEVPFDFKIKTFNEITLNIQQYEEPWNTLWDASVVLSRYLLTLEPQKLIGKRVIELGAGCGLVGIIAGIIGANATVTDLPEYVPMLEHNINANKQYLAQSEGTVVADTLDWGNKQEIETKYNPPVDYIVGSDIVYALQGFEDLVTTMNTLADENTQILLAYEHRWKDVENYFAEEAEKYFTITKLEYEDHNPSFRLQNIHIFKLQKKVKDYSMYLGFSKTN